MFNLNKTILVNSATDATTGVNMFAGTSTSFFLAKAGSPYYAANILSLNETKYQASSIETAYIIVPTAATASYDVVRLDLYVGLADSTESSYGMGLARFEKPLSVQIPTSGVPATDAAAFVAEFNKMKVRMDYGPVNVAIDGTDPTKIVFTGKNAHQRFKSCIISGAKTIQYANQLPTSTVLSNALVVSSKGVIGFGDEEYMRTSVKIPTLENNAYLALGRDEQVMNGGKYSCFVLRYSVPRTYDYGIGGFGGNNYVTTYIYVESGVLSSFETEIKKTYPSMGVIYLSVSNDSKILSVLIDGTQGTAKSLVVAHTSQLSVSEAGNITYSTSDATKATVDANGLITAVAAGTATITVTNLNTNEWNTVTVTVTAS